MGIFMKCILTRRCDGNLLLAVFSAPQRCQCFLLLEEFSLLNIFPVWVWICLALGHLFDTYSSIIWPNQNSKILITRNGFMYCM